MKQAKKVFREMLVGLLVWVILTGVLLALVMQEHFAAAVGSAFGGVVAVGIIFHMYRHLDIALAMDAAHAQRHIQMSSVQRLLLMGVALVAAFLFPKYIYPPGVIVSLFGIKITALLNPFIHRLLCKRMERGAQNVEQEHSL